MNDSPNYYFYLLLFLVITGIIVYAVYLEHAAPKWKRVYFYLRREFASTCTHSQDDIRDIKIILLDRYKLKASQVDDAIENMFDEEWFKENIV